MNIYDFPIYYAIPFFSFLIALGLTFAYKFLTDQKKMKELKEGLNADQAEIKKHKDDPNKMLEIQKQMMTKNLEYMKASFKATFYTIIPVLLIFAWLSSHYSYMPIEQNSSFKVVMTFVEEDISNVTIIVPDEILLADSNIKPVYNKMVEFKLRSSDFGKYRLDFLVDNLTYSKELIVNDNLEYVEPVTSIKDGKVKDISINYGWPIALNLFGWQLGWLGAYIIYSIIFSMILRKLLNIY